MSNSDALAALREYRATGDTIHRDRIVTGNLRLIVWMAHRYQHNHPHVDINDLAHVGSIGFMEGLNKFEFSSVERRVASYAINYTKKRILLFLEEEVPEVRIGRRAVGSARQAMRQMDSVMQEYEANVPIDYLLSHKGPAERIGALDVYSVNPRQGTESFEVYGRAASPAETPVDNHDQQIALVFEMLELWERELLLSFYTKDEGQSFIDICGKLQMTVSDGRATVRKAIARVKGQLVPPAGCP